VRNNRLRSSPSTTTRVTRRAPSAWSVAPSGSTAIDGAPGTAGAAATIVVANVGAGSTAGIDTTVARSPPRGRDERIVNSGIAKALSVSIGRSAIRSVRVHVRGGTIGSEHIET
jgi:hypothetical protein